MIFVTVGSQTPFERLLRAVDTWAGERGHNDTFAQIGRSAYVPKHIAYAPSLDPKAFRAHVRDAELVVAHAGMGTVITALQFGTPLLIMPRLGRLRETRNDHQVATAKWLAERQGITVAHDEAALVAALDRLSAGSAPTRVSPWASDALLTTISAFLDHSRPAAALPER